MLHGSNAIKPSPSEGQNPLCSMAKTANLNWSKKRTTTTDVFHVVATSTSVKVQPCIKSKTDFQQKMQDTDSTYRMLRLTWYNTPFLINPCHHMATPSTQSLFMATFRKELLSCLLQFFQMTGNIYVVSRNFM